MKSRYPVGSSRMWLLVVGAVLLAAGYAARPACAVNYRIIPLQVTSGGLLDPQDFNAKTLDMVGNLTATNGSISGFELDLFDAFRGGDAALYTVPGTDSRAFSISGAGHISGRIGENGAIWYFLPPNTIRTFTLNNIAGAITQFVRYTDNNRFLLHLIDKSDGSLADSAIGQLNPSSGALNLVFPPEDNSTFGVFADLDGNVVGGSTVSKVSDASFPLLGTVAPNGAVTPLQIQRPNGFAPGSSGNVYFVDANGNGFGDWKPVGGNFQAGIVGNDGISTALGTPTPFDAAYALGKVGDVAIVNAYKNDKSPEESFIFDGQSFKPLGSIAATGSGWTTLHATAVNPLGLIGTGMLNGVKTGFVLLPESVGAAKSGTLTQSVDIVRPGSTIQLTFSFTVDANNPPKAAQITLSDPTVAAFTSIPTGAKVIENGKTLLIPLNGETQVTTGVQFASTLDGDRDVRFTGSTSATVTPFAQGVFVLNYVTVQR